MKARFSLARSLLLAAFAFALPALHAAESDADLFAYDRGRPLNLQQVGSETRDGALVRDITFEGATGPVKAFLVSPATPAGDSHAAILFVHWFGEPKTTNRTQFLGDAIELARRGVVSLLVDTMWAEQRRWWSNVGKGDDRADGINQVITLRRAMDLLLAQPGVDAARFALVGHDFGAMFGSVAGAVDGRPKAYVLMAPTPRLADWYLFVAKPADVEAYKRGLEPLDAINAVGRLNAPVFFQFATNDQYVPMPRPTEFYDAAKPRKFMASYDTNHDLHPPEIAADRIAWLVNELKLK